jgi:hypothetical protein
VWEGLVVCDWLRAARLAWPAACQRLVPWMGYGGAAAAGDILVGCCHRTRRLNWQLDVAALLVLLLLVLPYYHCYRLLSGTRAFPPPSLFRLASFGAAGPPQLPGRGTALEASRVSSS